MNAVLRDPRLATLDGFRVEIDPALADSDARWGDYASALNALDAAEALHGVLPPEYEAKRREWRAEDRPAVCFIIGGADGLATSLHGRAKLKLAFGTATWPHQLVRVMLLEQLYRAGTILAGHPYHRA